MSATLKKVDALAFPNIYFALKLLGTLPITTCECERSFSSLRSIKTWDRSTKMNGRLNGLALLFIHREINCVRNNWHISPEMQEDSVEITFALVANAMATNYNKLTSNIYVASDKK